MPGSSSVETIARLSAYAKPGGRGVAVDGDHEEVALTRGAKQPDLRGPGA